jgi:hypothetical protein
VWFFVEEMDFTCVLEFSLDLSKKGGTLGWGFTSQCWASSSTLVPHLWGAGTGTGLGSAQLE